MPHIYTEEENQFLIDNVKGISLKALTNKFNEKFKLNLSESSIANKKNKLGISSGIKGGQFIKGQISWNKGKKWDDYMPKDKQENCRKTIFKKGNIPSNRRKIFEERIGKYGYTEIKIKDGCLNNNWVPKHRYIYEKKYGPIPAKHKVIFLDGDITNFDISNLKMISSAEELIMNRYNLRTNKKELTETGHLIAKVINKRGKLKSERL